MAKTTEPIQPSLFGELAPEPAAQPAGAPGRTAGGRTAKVEKVRAVEPSPEVVALAERLPREIYLGGSTWSFPGWNGLLYDGDYNESALARHGLAAYAKHPLHRAVGVDRTYYAPVAPAVLAGYAAQVPENFRFLVKAQEVLTLPRFPEHARYGEHRGLANPRYLDAAYATNEVVAPFVEGLGEKGGGLLFQFSPRHPESPEAFADGLHRFLAALPRGPRYTVELRTPAMLTPAYAAALADTGACHCLSVYTGMPDLKAQVQAVGAGTAPALFVRWIVQPGWTYARARAAFQPFSRIVEEDLRTRRAVAQLCLKAHQRGMPALVTIHNIAEGSSPPSIEALAEEIVGQREDMVRP